MYHLPANFGDGMSSSFCFRNVEVHTYTRAHTHIHIGHINTLLPRLGRRVTTQTAEEELQSSATAASVDLLTVTMSYTAFTALLYDTHTTFDFYRASEPRISYSRDV